MYGDTYGPVSYFLYVPFRAIFGWSGTWDYLPAAHAAAIFFDLLTVVGLFFLGRRIRDTALGHRCSSTAGWPIRSRCTR